MDKWRDKSNRRKGIKVEDRAGVRYVSMEQPYIEIMNTRNRNWNYKDYLRAYELLKLNGNPLDLATEEKIVRDKDAAARQVRDWRRRCEQIIATKEYLDIR